MTNYIGLSRFLPRLVNHTQRAMMSTTPSTQQRPPLTSKRIQEFEALVTKAIQRANDDIRNNYADRISKDLDRCNDFQRNKQKFADASAKNL